MNTAKRQAKFWWVTAFIFALVWLFIWLTVDKANVVGKSANNAEAKTFNDLSLPKKIEALGDFVAEVSPLSLESAKQDLRSYAEEFKDKAFFEKNKNKWTIQVMDTITHENVTNYLEIRKDKHQDRDKFYYFRYVDDSSKEHYVLIYDLFPNRVMANGVWSDRERYFDLPRNEPIVIKQMKEYLAIIDGYMREEEVVEESVKIPKEPVVALKETDKPTKAEPIKESELVKQNKESAKAVQKAQPVEEVIEVIEEPEDNEDEVLNSKKEKAEPAKESSKSKSKDKSKEPAQPPTAKPNQDAQKFESKSEPDPATVVSLEPEDDGGTH